MDNSNNDLGEINVSLSAGNNKIKYYECNDNNFIFEIFDENQNCCKENINNQESPESKIVKNENSILNKTLGNESRNFQEETYDFKESNEEDSYGIEGTEQQKDGEIIVTSILDCGNDEYLQGVKINLYKINGLSPVLIDSKITDEEGKVIFSKIEKGSYRIIELVDKRYFEKPKYIKWNEITVDFNNKQHKVVVVNKIKRFVANNRYN